jgi:hypothetical protein
MPSPECTGPESLTGSALPFGVLCQFALPHGEWIIEVDDERNRIIIRPRTGNVSGRGARRLLLVDGGDL